jgi:hypothetical protein
MLYKHLVKESLNFLLDLSIRIIDTISPDSF